MRFTLKNLGRLEEATIDLSKDLIILTGPNNTSKTYVAHAIYGFCLFAGPDSPFMDEVFHTHLDRLIPPPAAPSPDRLDVDLAQLTRDHLDFLLAQIGQECSAQLTDFFAADASFAAGASVLLSLDEGDRDRIIRDLSDLSYREPVTRERVVVEKPGGVPVLSLIRRPSLNGNGEGTAPESSEDLRRMAGRYVALILSRAFFATLGHPYILTAERAAIQLFSHELSLERSELVDLVLRTSEQPPTPRQGATMDPLALLRKGAKRYPRAIRDGLRVADDLAKVRAASSEGFGPVADKLDAEVLQGAVHVTEDGEMRFKPADSDVDLRLHLASSSVKSLAGLAFYLRHLARRGHFLIIDEPELNLHPDNQRRVGRLLARLSRAGIKVMISTHSDYIIRELNNLIMLSSDTEGKLLDQFGYTREETIEPARVGAYLFRPTRAEPIAVEPSGFDADTIDAEIHSLNRSAQRIYNTLFDA